MRAKDAGLSLVKINRHPVSSYVIASVGVLVAGLSHWWLVPLIGDTPPMRLLLVVVVTVSAWLGGLGPSLLATVLGLITIVATDDMPGDFRSLLTRLLRFGSLAVLISLLFEALHASRRRIERKEGEYGRREVWYRHLVETAADGIWVIDRDQRTTYANPRLGEMLGIPPAQLIGLSLEDFLVDTGDLPGNWLDNSADGSPAWHEVRLRGGGNAVRNAIVSAWPIGTDDGLGAGARVQENAPDGLLLMVKDLTPLKRAEEALREKESVLRSFYESSPRAMGVIELTEDDARFISANAVTGKFFGLRPDTLEGKTAKELGAPPDLLAIWIKQFNECRATGHPIRFEYQSAWPTSDPLWVAATISTMSIPRSERVLCSFILENITHRKRAEEDLRDAKERAEAASQAKDRFLAVLSHELRTPMTPVLIAVSSLLESNPDSALVPTLEMIRRNIELEARLIDDLLDLSRIVRGRLRLDLEVVDIHQAIQRAVEICRDDAVGSGLNVVTELNAKHHHATVDHARLMQVVWNLIKNAAKFTPAGGRLIIRTTNPSELSGCGDLRSELFSQWLAVEFEDTGIGIDAAMLSRIFDPFEQGWDDRHGRSSGLGLGLAISRSLAESLGGRLTATSPGLGLGSTFRLELTTIPSPTSTPTAGNGTATPAPSLVSPRGPDLRILVVEDNPDTLRFLAIVLRQRGHNVVAADCLAAARAQVDEAEAPFDLLLSDIELPDGDGLELMRELKATRAMPGIAMSGFGAEEDLRLSREAGFLDHLTKPIDLNRLNAAIRRVTSHDSNRHVTTEPFGSITEGSGSGAFKLT
jgi:PAS domain S-box-containing protein